MSYRNLRDLRDLLHGTGGSSTLTQPPATRLVPPSQRNRHIDVPVVRIDDVVHEDVWLLKMDLQGYEWHALSGASRLFTTHTVAHVFTEYTPRLLRAAGVHPRALVDLLKHHGMICFDVRPGDGRRVAKEPSAVAAPWALTRNHPLAIDDYLAAMRTNDAAGARQNEVGRMGREAIWYSRYGSFDDLACVNIGKAWQPSQQSSGLQER